jgi:hypothetical protein
MTSKPRKTLREPDLIVVLENASRNVPLIFYNKCIRIRSGSKMSVDVRFGPTDKTEVSEKVGELRKILEGIDLKTLGSLLHPEDNFPTEVEGFLGHLKNDGYALFLTPGYLSLLCEEFGKIAHSYNSFPKDGPQDPRAIPCADRTYERMCMDGLKGHFLAIDQAFEFKKAWKLGSVVFLMILG